MALLGPETKQASSKQRALPEASAPLQEDTEDHGKEKAENCGGAREALALGLGARWGLCQAWPPSGSAEWPAVRSASPEAQGASGATEPSLYDGMRPGQPTLSVLQGSLPSWPGHYNPLPSLLPMLRRGRGPRGKEDHGRSVRA